MCEMCAYVGRKRQAAPILLEYGSRIEGLWSGFCTGIGVQNNDGTLQLRKTLGYSRYWKEQYKITDLPGTIGFFHSRTGYQGCPGDSRFAHPFLSSDGEVMAVSQGAIGIFAEKSGSISRIGNELLKKGRHFTSADFHLEADRYIALDDGSRVHMSNIICEYVASLLESGYTPLEAIRKAGMDIQEESATMFLMRKYPGHLFVINMNQRLGIYFHKDGVSLATCALAYGDERVNLMETPQNSVLDITANNVYIEMLSEELQPYQKIPAGLQDAFLEWTAEHPDTMLPHVMDNVLKVRQYPPRVLRHVPTHEIFEQLYYDGKLELSSQEYPGIRQEENSIRTVISLRNK